MFILGLTIGVHRFWCLSIFGENRHTIILFSFCSLHACYRRSKAPQSICCPLYIVNFIALPSFARNSSHMALCHMTELTNQNLPTTMAVLNDAQLSKYFDSLCLANGILIFTLSPELFTILHSPLFCQFILHRKPMKFKISLP